MPLIPWQRYHKALGNEAPTIIGTSIEELFRFVPQLRASGVQAIVDIFRTICIIGGEEEEVEKARQQLRQKQEAASASSSAAVVAAASSMPMDTDSTASPHPTPPTSSTEAAGADVKMTNAASTGDVVVPPSGEAAALEPEPFDFSLALSCMDSVEAQGYLPDSISHSTKMLEALLCHTETSKDFIESGGVDLLLKVRV